MASEELFRACRIGDLERLRYLFEEADVEINVRDQWNSTPLYYACLCGHDSIVQFLLQRGATCEPSSFDGERCVYAALNDRIRALLKDYKAITPECMRRDSYRECFRRCLEDQAFVDVCFDIHGVKVHAHRVILSARSSYFEQMFETKWKGRSLIRLNHPMVRPWAFKAIMQFLYTGRLYVDVSGVEDCIILAKQCKLLRLKELLRERLNFIDTFEKCRKGSRPIKVVSVEPESFSRDLNEAFGSLVELALPLPFRYHQMVLGVFNDFLPEEMELLLPFMSIPTDEEECVPCDKPPYSDICFVVEESRFYCHKVIMCGRSDYFKALLLDHFCEAVLPDNNTAEETIPEVTLHDVTADVFAAVIAYIYQDTAKVKVENLFNVLCAADMYLLNGLKRLCANQIKQHLEVDNVIPILRTARLFALEGLESSCILYMAQLLENFIDDPAFHRLIQEDAAAIKNRQEKDTIPIIDEIRFHLLNNILPVDKFPENNVCDIDVKLSLLNGLLQSLNLECFN